MKNQPCVKHDWQVYPVLKYSLWGGVIIAVLNCGMRYDCDLWCNVLVKAVICDMLMYSVR